MDIKNSLSYRTDRYNLFNYTGSTKYDYEREGILKKVMPKIFFKGNAVFVTFLQLIDLRFIMLMKYIDKLKHFKHVTGYD